MVAAVFVALMPKAVLKSWQFLPLNELVAFLCADCDLQDQARLFSVQQKQVQCVLEPLSAVVQLLYDQFGLCSHRSMPCVHRSSKESMKAEVAAAEARGKAEAEKAGLQTALDAALSRAEAEQSCLQATVHGLETDAKEYKVSHLRLAACF